MQKRGVKQSFQGRLVAKGPRGAWTYLPIPFDVQTVFGTRSRVPVCGTINGFPFRNSLMPEGDGTHSMMVGKELQAGAKAKAGEDVQVLIQLDTAERVVAIPDELQVAFAGDALLSRAFEKLAPSHKKEYADWITTAKRPETKMSRVAKALEMIRAGKHVR